MPFSSISLLQFPELKSLLAKFAGSSAGRERIDQLEPHSDRDTLESDFADAAEAISYAREASSGPGTDRHSPVRLRFDQLREVSPAIRVLQVSGTRLDGPEILDLF